MTARRARKNPPKKLFLWEFSVVHAKWVVARNLTAAPPEDVQPWLARFQKDEPGKLFMVARLCLEMPL